VYVRTEISSDAERLTSVKPQLWKEEKEEGREKKEGRG
jgi:hypothetical protein